MSYLHMKRVAFLVLIILIIDQWSKIYVKTHFLLGESIEVFNWFRISFVENEGAAWGLRLPSEWGKLILTIFRLFAVSMIGYWLIKLIKNRKNAVFIYAATLVFAGAVGNIIDSVFYGVLFSDSTHALATFLPDTPYSTWFYGRVVDMLYFPFFEFVSPEWMPFIGGKYFEFFRYVFNISDVVITLGAVGLLIAFKKEKKESLTSRVEKSPNLS